MRQLPSTVVLRVYPSETVADIFQLLLSSQGVFKEQLYTVDAPMIYSNTAQLVTLVFYSIRITLMMPPHVRPAIAFETTEQQFRSFPPSFSVNHGHSSSLRDTSLCNSRRNASECCAVLRLHYLFSLPAAGSPGETVRGNKIAREAGAGGRIHYVY